MPESDQKELPPAAVIATVSPKLPDFWPHAAAVWNSQIEAQFRVAGITRSQTMYDLAVQRLGEATTVRLQDLLITPPADPYQALVKRLVSPSLLSRGSVISTRSRLLVIDDRRSCSTPSWPPSPASTTTAAPVPTSSTPSSPGYQFSSAPI